MITREDVRSGVTALFFGMGSGSLSLIIPFLLLRGGASYFVVGLVTTLAGLSQLVTRFFVPKMMRLMPDKGVVLLSAILLAFGILLSLSFCSLWVLAAVQLLHGALRAFFWTGLQTHSVRGENTAIRGLAAVNFCNGVGAVLGPVILGILIGVTDIHLAILSALVFALVAVVASVFLTRYMTFGQAKGFVSPRAWTHDTVLGSWMSALAGSWRGVLDTYAPVLLIAMAFSESQSSVLIAVSNGSILIGTLLATRMSVRSNKALYLGAVLAAGMILVALPLSAGLGLVTGIVMILGGLNSGIFQTYGTALAAVSVAPELRGDVITITGVFRSVALLGLPSVMTALSTMLPLATVFAIAGGGLLFSGFGVFSKGHSRDTEVENA